VEGKTFCQGGWRSEESKGGFDLSKSSSSSWTRQGDRVGSAEGWFSYLMLVYGHFGLEEEHSMFPNIAVHCGMGLIAHNVRDVYDLVNMVAVPQEAAIRQHAVFAVRIAMDRGCTARWALTRLIWRWGKAALDEHGVDLEFLEGLGVSDRC
jgi:hypothetical protein